MVTKLYERVDEAVQRGEMWRAKEILRGSIRSRGYDTELYERYGRLLLDLQETLEAGKYLLLSGMRRPEYEAAIDLYLSRIRVDTLYYSFPRSARLPQISDYPDAVRSDLARVGLQPPMKIVQEPDEGMSMGCWMVLAPAAALAVTLLLLAAIGLWSTARWLIF